MQSFESGETMAPVRLPGEGPESRGRPAAHRRTVRSGSGIRGAFGQSIHNGELVTFTRQLAILLKAGLPMVRGLQVLARQSRTPALRELIESLAEGIRCGGSLSDGIALHEAVFGRLYVRMVTAGEAGGVLVVVLGRLAEYLEKNRRIAGRIRAAMIYPGIVTAVAGAITIALLTLVVPRFEDIFSGLLKDRPLPLFTQLLLTTSELVREHYVAGAAGVLVLALVPGFLVPHRSLRHALNRLATRIPLLGPLLAKASIARFARTFGTLLSAGVPILQALAMTRETNGHEDISAAIRLVHDRVRVGGSVAAALAASRHFPAMATSMVEVGEETGALPEMLQRIADIYDEEVDMAVAGLTAFIEPMMIVFMALVVGAIVLALFLPLAGIVQQL